MRIATSPPTSPSRRLAIIVALSATVLAVLAGAAPASAHDSTDGSTVVTIDASRVIVGASVGFTELGFVDTSGDGVLDAEELADQEAGVASSLVSVVRDRVELTVDGEPVEIIGAGVQLPSESSAEDATASPYVMLAIASDRHDGDVADIELSWGFDRPVEHGRALVSRRCRDRRDRGRRHHLVLARHLVERNLVLRSRHRAHPVRARPPAVPARAHAGGRRHDGFDCDDETHVEAGHRVHRRPCVSASDWPTST